jgi:hypothetical protein
MSVLRGATAVLRRGCTKSLVIPKVADRTACNPVSVGAVAEVSEMVASLLFLGLWSALVWQRTKGEWIKSGVK